MRTAIRLFAALCVACSVPAPVWSAEPREHVVRVVTDYDNLRLYFSPKVLHIEPGDTVTWVNQVNEDHNMVTYPDGFPDDARGFASPLLKRQTEQWSHTFTRPGSYEYHCIPHLLMGMHGVVIVGRPSRADEFHSPTARDVASYRKKLFEYFTEDDIKEFPKEMSQRLQSVIRKYRN